MDGFLANVSKGALARCGGSSVPVAKAVGAFVRESGPGTIAVFLEVPHRGSQASALCRIPLDLKALENFLPEVPEPPAPKGNPAGILQTQKKDGWSEVLPRLIGFETFSDKVLKFPILDTDRDKPQ